MADNPADGAPTRIRAAIDIGTNSFHLVVARLGEHGGLEILTSEKENVRLGQGGGEMKQLAPDAIERGIAALARLAQVATSFGDVEVVAVATSAVREASNRREFLDRARDEVGIDIEVISGFEEARLIHRGVLHALPVYDRRLLLVDIGGGSTELLVGEGDAVIEARSMKLGAIRLTERFFTTAIATGRAPSASEQQECRNYVRAALAPVAHELGGHQPEVAIGSSGTASTLAAMAAAGRGHDVRLLNAFEFTAAELDSVVAAILSCGTAARRKLPGLDERRSDIIVGGAILLHEIFAMFGLTTMTISGFALREGVLFDRFADTHALDDLRRANLLRLARQLDPDPVHAEHTAALATQLFDRTEPLHGLGRDARELLDAAALVHNVGLFISHSSHHKHSYYVVRNSEQLTGFSEDEIELIALIARYHRKSRPSDKHPEFATLSPERKALVRTLAGILRIAIGLDRRHAAIVQSMRVHVTDEVVRIEPTGAPADELELEIYAANERAALLAEAFGRRIEVAPAAVPSGPAIETSSGDPVASSP